MRSQFRFPLSIAIALGCGACALCGCQEDLNTPLPEPVIYPVEGKVTVQGKPLAKAVITFLQVDENGTTSVSETDDEGHYQLTYMSRIGTAAATYKVVISYLYGTDGTIYGLAPRSGLAKPYGMFSAKERIIPEWSDFGRASHQVTVARGGGTHDFDLKEPLLPPPVPETPAKTETPAKSEKAGKEKDPAIPPAPETPAKSKTAEKEKNPTIK